MGKVNRKFSFGTVKEKTAGLPGLNQWRLGRGIWGDTSAARGAAALIDTIFSLVSDFGHYYALY